MKSYFSFLLLVFSSVMFSQKYVWVYFKDKPNAQTYFDVSLKMLFVCVLERTTNQNIPLDLKSISFVDKVVFADKTLNKTSNKVMDSHV
ncbi:hypothetical protein NJT12_13150 [Flavobacterium sp. AC]|uniref:Uncharacterized protein n=1 Tax=Flavobacterium azizsancarii TaxID=2961580 RepID=A0ABT4WDA8_9FLAO|nr:hypothetical protein [Flavobacterium azizsancarii]MDA6070568.1 hypothetical protein [Flavobacterium azizsancarii]